jgi:hypothetical protein
MRNANCRWLLSGAFVVIAVSGLSAQNPQLQIPNAGRFPIVVFTSVKWNADPSYYSIAIDSSGTATYQSAPNGTEKTGVPYTIEFQVSDRTRRIIFNLAQRLNYFAGDFPGTTGQPQTNDVRTLQYRYSGVDNQFTYTTSTDTNVEEITSVFEELSQTFEYGRKLRDFEAHDKKAVLPELEAMRAKAERRALRDFPALVAILHQLASDNNLDKSTRADADALAKMASQPSVQF